MKKFIIFGRKGKYTFDRFRVSALSNANYDRHASEDMARRLDVETYSNRAVKGKVDAGSGGVLFLSIPAFDNWEIHIDGNRVEKIENLDTAFVGAQVLAGEHEVQLKYKNRYAEYGGIISLAGVMLLIVTTVSRRRRRGVIEHERDTVIKSDSSE